MAYCLPLLFDSGSWLVVPQSKLVLENAEELDSLFPNSDESVGICQEGNVDSDTAVRFSAAGLLFSLGFVPILT